MSPGVMNPYRFPKSQLRLAKKVPVMGIVRT